MAGRRGTLNWGTFTFPAIVEQETLPDQESYLHGLRGSDNSPRRLLS